MNPDHIRRSLCFKYLFYWYVRLLFATYRLLVGDVAEGEEGGVRRSGIFCFAPREVLLGLFFLWREKMFGHIITDDSTEGELLEFVAERLGFHAIRNTGKVSFVREALDVLELNKRLVVINWKERGRHSTVRLSAYLAARSEVPLIAASCRSSASLTFPLAAHGVEVALPFGRVRILLHAPRYFVIDREDKTITETSSFAADADE